MFFMDTISVSVSVYMNYCTLFRKHVNTCRCFSSAVLLLPSLYFVPAGGAVRAAAAAVRMSTPVRRAPPAPPVRKGQLCSYWI